MWFMQGEWAEMKCPNCLGTGFLPNPSEHAVDTMCIGCHVCRGTGKARVLGPILVLWFLCTCGGFLAWHAGHYMCRVSRIPNPDLLSYVLAVPIGAWLVFGPFKTGRST